MTDTRKNQFSEIGELIRDRVLLEDYLVELREVRHVENGS